MRIKAEKAIFLAGLSYLHAASIYMHSVRIKPKEAFVFAAFSDLLPGCINVLQVRI